MAAAARRPGAKRPPAIPFPQLPDAQTAPNDLFWRAAWLRTQAKLAALDAHAVHVSAQRRTSEVLRHALAGAQCDLQIAASGELKHLVDAGGLLYAWLPEGGAQ